MGFQAPSSRTYGDRYRSAYSSIPVVIQQQQRQQSFASPRSQGHLPVSIFQVSKGYCYLSMFTHFYAVQQPTETRRSNVPNLAAPTTAHRRPANAREGLPLFRNDPPSLRSSISSLLFYGMHDTLDPMQSFFDDFEVSTAIINASCLQVCFYWRS